MAWLVEDRRHWRFLNNRSCIHHYNPITKFRNHAKVVRDQNLGKSVLRPQIRQ
jgi:hypothetical protein